MTNIEFLHYIDGLLLPRQKVDAHLVIQKLGLFVVRLLTKPGIERLDNVRSAPAYPALFTNEYTREVLNAVKVMLEPSNEPMLSGEYTTVVAPQISQRDVMVGSRCSTLTTWVQGSPQPVQMG